MAGYTITTLPPAPVGIAQIYTGTNGTGSGFFDDPFFGRFVYLSLDSFRTIGNGSSGAAIAAAWTQTLFEHLWNQYNNTQCPLLDSGGSGASRGANATADFAANRRITLFDARGRAIIAAGTGSTLTARTKGAQVGTETHTLGSPEIPSHTHPGPGGASFYTNAAGTAFASVSGVVGTIGANTGSTGGGGSHNNIQPSQAEHLIITAGVRL